MSVNDRKFAEWVGLGGPRPSAQEMADYLERELDNREEVDAIEAAVTREAIAALREQHNAETKYNGRKFVVDAPPVAPTLLDQMTQTLRNVEGADLSDEKTVTRLLTSAGFRLGEITELGEMAAKRAKETT